jgi:hypothetical protein
VLAVAQGRNTYAAWLTGHIVKVDGGSRLSVLLTIHPVAVTAVLGIFVGPQIVGWLYGNGFSAMWAAASDELERRCN